MSALFGSLLVQLACLSIASANEETVAYNIETVTIRNPLPLGYTEFPSIHTAYGVVQADRTWQGAKEACLDHNAFLAVIDTQEKIGFVGQNRPQGSEVWVTLAGQGTWVSANENSDVWVGITRQGTDWVSGNENLRLSNLPWATGQPSAVGDCVVLKRGGAGLSTENCSEVKPYICQLRTTLPEKESTVPRFG